MPILPAPRPALPHAAAQPGAESLGGLFILVAAEDVWVRWTLCGWLACLGVTVRQVGNGAAALEAFGDGARFDLVITDLRSAMPDGVWLVATLRTLGLDTPCLLVGTRSRGLAARAQRLVRTLAVDAPASLDSLVVDALRALALE